MRIQGLFPTPLIICELSGADATCALLRETILTHERATPSVSRSTEGGWQSGSDFEVWSGAEGAAVLGAAREVADHHTAVLEGAAMVKQRLDWRVNAWANVNRAGAGNDLHYHPGAFWSACFYVDDGGVDGKDHLGGGIEFIDPRGVGPLMHAPSVKISIAHCATAGLGETFYPKSGMLLMFPSWLGHRVTRYLGEDARISVAMNFSV